MNHVVGHVVLRTHAVELQGILLGNKRNELGRVAVNGQQFLMGSRIGIGSETLHGIIQVQAIGRHVPFGFLQGTDVLVHREVEVTFLVKIVILNLLRVEVHIGAIVGRGKSYVAGIGRIKEEVG